MADPIVVPQLWNNTILPEGQFLCWLVADGTAVRAGQSIALIRVEGRLHELTARSEGQIRIEAPANSRIEPGSVLGNIRSSEKLAVAS